MQSRLAGLAKVWYNGLTDYDLSWSAWKEALERAFPSHTDYVDLLKQMLGRTKIKEESMMHYFYSKNMLVKKCGLNGTEGVSCIIDGLPLEQQGNAKAGKFGHKARHCSSKMSQKAITEKGRQQTVIICTNCGKRGHSEDLCWSKTKMKIPCSRCGKPGHDERACWSRRVQQRPARSVENEVI
jgi:hypothetical protein